MPTIHVHTLGDQTPRPEEEFSLFHNSWNDWWEYETLYRLVFWNKGGEFLEIGYVKIATEPLVEKQPTLPSVIKEKIPNAFSLGQDASYYSNLWLLSSELAVWVLDALGDIAYDANKRQQIWHRDVTQRSLMRDVPYDTFEEQLTRAAHGGTKLEPYRFRFHVDKARGDQSPILDFSVTPGSTPPTNVHVLIGRNGSGKSTLLRNMLVSFTNTDKLTSRIKNIVDVSFSAFDSFKRLEGDIGTIREVTSISLYDTNNHGRNKSYEELEAELSKSLRECLAQPRRTRLRSALNILENDPLFARQGIASTLSTTLAPEEIVRQIVKKFRSSSSGHAIVLLTIVGLIHRVEEKTLILIDEPETHLHPPLLSAFLKALSELLSTQNGLAVVATHSPVVLQEVPRECVWKIARAGDVSAVGRPEIETFGENVGILTHDVFGLEVQGTGFYSLLREVAHESETFEQAVDAFGGSLGSEARGILNVLMMMKTKGAKK